MKISLANSQKETERIIRNLERGNENMALLQIRELRKSAYNRYYRAARKFEDTMPTGIDYQLQLASVRTAKRSLTALMIPFRKSAIISGIRKTIHIRITEPHIFRLCVISKRLTAISNAGKRRGKHCGRRRGKQERLKV